MKAIEVNPKDTSKACSNCGNIQDVPLSERTFFCVRCGMLEDRNINAARNILKRATIGLAGSHAQKSNVKPQLEAVAAELRIYPAIAGEALNL